MGKKKNKSFYKNQLRPFVRNNDILLAALGGAAAGIALTALLGTEKAQQILRTVESSMADFTTKVRDKLAAPDDDVAIVSHKSRKNVPAM